MLLKKEFISFMRRPKCSWTMPEGYDTGIKVYNCITKDKQPLIVKNKHCVTWYTCGPTVYDSSHLGHGSCFVKLDVIQRILKNYFQLNLVTVMNITDVDDKIIKRSKELNVSTQEVANQYEKEFWNDMNLLQIEKPHHIIKVTENIKIINNFIKKLIDVKIAYYAEDKSVYFDVKKINTYGKLQNIGEGKLDEENTKYKKCSMDFALWKAAKPDEISWESPWGSGRPGWHIECSALASHVLGSNIDIHAGGIDLRFPHHENEEAQSCAFHQTSQWVNYWIHSGHLHLKNSEKMSKSLKNTISISSMLQNTTPEAFRMACVMSHYRSPMEFSVEFMSTASTLIKNYKNFFDNCRNYINGYIKVSIDNSLVDKLIIDSSNKIHNGLIDDFNTPLVVSTLNEIVSSINSLLHSSAIKDDSSFNKSPGILAASNLVAQTLNLFGIDLNSCVLSTKDDSNLAEIMDILNNFRQDIRQIGISTKDKTLLKLCDGVRDDLKKRGITIKDHGKLSSWA